MIVVSLSLLLLLFSTHAVAGEAEFGTQGYFRAGLGISSGSVQNVFRHPELVPNTG